MFDNLSKKQEKIIDAHYKYGTLVSLYNTNNSAKKKKMDAAITDEDRKLIETYKRKPDDDIDPETRLKSKIFEGALIKHGETMFGEKTFLSPASEYDDWINGTDAVLEIENGNEEPIRIAIDATLCKTSERADIKLRNITQNIETLDNKKTEQFYLKYFESRFKNEGIKGYSSIPKVILGEYAEDFDRILEEMKSEHSVMPYIFLKMMKAQLESWFVFVLMVNSQKIDAAKGDIIKPELWYKDKKMRKMYKSAIQSVDNSWNKEKTEEALKLYEKEEGVFGTDDFSIPKYASLVSNTKNALDWICAELETQKKRLEELDAEKIKDFENNEVVQKLESHLERDVVLKYRPIFV